MAEAIKIGGGGGGKIHNGQIAKYYAKNDKIKANTFVKIDNNITNNITISVSSDNLGGFFPDNSILIYENPYNDPTNLILKVYQYDANTGKHQSTAATSLSISLDNPYQKIDVSVVGNVIVVCAEGASPTLFYARLFKRNPNTNNITDMGTTTLASATFYNYYNESGNYFVAVNCAVMENGKLACGLETVVKERDYTGYKDVEESRLFLLTISQEGTITDKKLLYTESNNVYSGSTKPPYIVQAYFYVTSSSDKKFLFTYFGNYDSSGQVINIDDNVTTNHIIAAYDNCYYWGGLQRVSDIFYVSLPIITVSSKILIRKYNPSDKSIIGYECGSDFLPSSVSLKDLGWVFLKQIDNDLYFTIQTLLIKVTVNTSNPANSLVTVLGVVKDVLQITSSSLNWPQKHIYELTWYVEDSTHNLISFSSAPTAVKFVYGENISYYERLLNTTQLISDENVKTNTLFGITQTSCNKFKKGKVATPLSS